MSDELWHLVEAKRDDGAPAMFRIRELAPQLDLPRIFVAELPYPSSELAQLPDAAAYQRLGKFEEQWLVPACAALGWVFVAVKNEDGSFFLYLYGNTEPTDLIERLSPFDASLGFFDDHDPTWDEYAALSELLGLAKAMPAVAAEAETMPLPTRRAERQPKPTTQPRSKPQPTSQPKSKPHPQPQPQPTPSPKPSPKTKPRPKAKAKPQPNAKPKPKGKPKTKPKR
jgi:hypothetical protein